MNRNEYLWQRGSGPAGLPASEVHLWRIPLEQRPQRVQMFREILSPDEKLRAERFHFERDRASFCLCRGFLRMLLGRYGGVAPEEVRFRSGKYGKLALDPHVHRENIEFNISHSRRVALFALARDRRVGVDIEEVRTTVGIADISRGFFSQQEDESIRSLPEDLKAAAFYACWTRKEATVKALGGSIAQLSGKVIVSTSPGEPARLIRMPSGSGGNHSWNLQDLPAGEGYAAALCYEGPLAAVFLWEPDE